MQPERGGMPTPHPQGVPMVNPQPLPFQTTVTGAQAPIVEQGEDGEDKTVLKEFVVLFHSTPAGTMIAMWDLDAAEKIALDLYGAVKKLRSNIVLPDGSQSLQQIVREAMEKELRTKETEDDDME